MLKIDWDDYHSMLRVLSTKIRENILPGQDGKIHLVGLPRGGTLIALHLSYLFEGFYVHFDGFKTAQLLDAEHVVVIDDVLETGKTRVKLMNSQNLSTISYFAVLIDKSFLYGIPPADVSIMRLESKIWVEFPYERPEDPKEIKSREERGYEADG